MALDRDARLHYVVDDFGLLREREREEIVEDGQVRAANDRADAVADFHDPEDRQGAQCLSQDRSAHAELRSEIAFRDKPVTRSQ